MSASGPGERTASARDVSIYLREDCRALDDSLQLEMVVAQYCLRIRDVLSTTGVPVGEIVGAGVVAALEHEGDALSHAILRGLADLAVGRTAERSAESAALLGERGIPLPDQFADVGKAMPLGAWRTDDGAFEGEYAFFADFEHPRGRTHSVALFVDPAHGGVVKHLGLMSAVSEFGPGDPFHPDVMEPMEIADAGVLVAELLERTYGPLAADTDDFRALIAAARARSMGDDRSSDRSFA